MAKLTLNDPEKIASLVKKRRDAEAKTAAVAEEKKDKPAYFLDEDGFICRKRMTKDGQVKVRLCNFSAEISQEDIVDDGKEAVHFYTVDAKLWGKHPLPKQEIHYSIFNGLSWVSKWGIKAVIEPGSTVRDSVRHYIQVNSSQVTTKTHYGHTGWREIDGEWVYLHATGAIGTEQAVSVRLPKELEKYSLPPLPDFTPGKQKVALRASLDLLDIGDRAVTLPLWCMTFLAPLTSLLSPKPNYSVYLYGRSGTRKSTTALLFLSHFGNFNSVESLSNFTDSITTLEQRGFVLCDTIHLIDDYSPSAFHSEAMATERLVQKIIRNYSNRTSRGRMNADLTERGRFEPRGMLLITAEELPSLESTLARIAVVEMSPTSLDMTKLTIAQKSASPLLAQAMSLYLLWVKKNREAIVAAFPERFRALRTKAAEQDVHGKLPEQQAYLSFALEMVAEFLTGEKILSDSEAMALVNEGWTVFRKMAESQMRRILDDDSVGFFSDILAALVMQGAVRLDPVSVDNGDKVGGGDRVGWFDSSCIYLSQTAAWHAISKFCVQEQTHFPFSRNTLFKMLRDKKIIATSGGGDNTVNVRIGGTVERVVKIIDGVVVNKVLHRYTIE